MKQLTDRQKTVIIGALDNIELPDKFTYTNYEPSTVVSSVMGYILNNKIPLQPYKPVWRWSRVVGYRNVGEYVIHYNVYKLSDEAAFLGMVCHEVCHMLAIGHGGNCMAWYCNGRKKTKSANVYLERAVKKHLRKKNE